LGGVSGEVALGGVSWYDRNSSIISNDCFLQCLLVILKGVWKIRECIGVLFE